MFTRDTGVLILDLDINDTRIHNNIELILNAPLWVFCHLFTGWTTPDMLLHHDVTIGHSVMLEPGAPLAGVTMRWERLHNCDLARF